MQHQLHLAYLIGDTMVLKGTRDGLGYMGVQGGAGETPNNTRHWLSIMIMRCIFVKNYFRLREKHLSEAQEYLAAGDIETASKLQRNAERVTQVMVFEVIQVRHGFFPIILITLASQLL